jgi:hypothetical protein
LRSGPILDATREPPARGTATGYENQVENRSQRQGSKGR